jgi:GNAT superfamily N-acetyltransferase
MVVRPAEPAEYAALGELCVAAYALDGELSERYAGQLRDVAGRAGGAGVLAAVEDAVLLGTVTFIADGGPSREIAREEEAEFRMLAVDPAHQRAGVGEALVRECIDMARARGRARLVCSSGTWMAAAHRLYERLGFAPAPDRDWSPIPGVRLRVFERPLR